MNEIACVPVLFLDVDGVLNSMTWFASQPPTAVTEVDPAAVRRIQRIVAATGAKVVLSSSWRNKGDNNDLEQKLVAAGVPIDDRTPWLDGDLWHRGDEIQQWLDDHPGTYPFAILDDDADAGEHHPARFVRTYTRVGMYGKHEKRVVELLSDGKVVRE